ncbi:MULTISPECIES: hypothetical protein [unclassified Mesorhizobium]|uniref:hypothetical protein n=1 Tax=unclassified Mesorhizobium TaxID=325217 RepID=UPI0012DE6649|nr:MULTISPECIES: hypothetical protein [unclassified Mesorhizobium]WJI50211.1 MucR family transcriptional regulator [Mesorhizobium sp. C089B]
MRSSEKTASLSGLSSQIAPVAKELVPAANPKKSVFADHIISLEQHEERLAALFAAPRPPYKAVVWAKVSGPANSHLFFARCRLSETA